ncbi:unnamed protein product [Ixodes persulcatus]
MTNCLASSQPIQVYAGCNDTVSIHANAVVICSWGGRGSSSFMFSFGDTRLPSTNKETFTYRAFTARLLPSCYRILTGLHSSELTHSGAKVMQADYLLSCRQQVMSEVFGMCRGDRQ